MHMNLHVFKHGKPVYWIVGGLIVFYVFYRIASGGSKSSSTGSGTVSMVQSGPSDAQVSAAAGISAAQIGANAQVAQGQLALAAQRDSNAAGVATATLEQQAHIYDTSAAADVGRYTAGLDAGVQIAGITAQQNIAQINSEYSFATARVAAETSLASQEIQAGVIRSSFDLQSHLSDNQALVFNTASNNERAAYIAGSLINQIPSAKANDRDNLIALISANSTGQSVSYNDRTSGSFSTGTTARSPVTSVPTSYASFA